MPARILALTAALFALCASDAAARVTVGVSNRVLVVSGTILRDEIDITQAGATLKVSDKDRVDPGSGCGHSGDNVACALAGIDRISVNLSRSDDRIQIVAPVAFLATVLGGDGDDVLSTNTTASGTILDGGDGNDTLSSGPNRDVLNGGDGNDTLESLGGDDRLDGGPGADTLRGGLQDDDLEGGTGPDTIVGEGGLDTASYTASAGVTARLGGTTTGNGSSLDAPGDTIDASVEALSGGPGPDTLNGGDGSDTLLGNAGNDNLFGGGGNDVLNPGPGVDLVIGNDGQDTASAAGSDVGTTIALGVTHGSGTAADLDAGGDTISGDVEDAEGGSGADTLIGTTVANRLEGGQGFDTVSYADRTTGVVVDADGQPDDGAPGEGDNVLQDVEAITGGLGDDQLTAIAVATGSLSLRGFANEVTVDKRLDGGPGADVLVGTDLTRDFIIGGGGQDQLQGRDKQDILDASGDGAVDQVDCGAGGTDFAKLDLVDTQVGCEALQIAAVGRHPTLLIRTSALAGRVLRVGVSCPSGAAGACKGGLEVALASGARQATKAFDVPRGAKRTLLVRLGAQAAARVRKAGRVRLTATERDPENRPKTSRAIVRLR
jgi:Ca2+-binding RTX toxin-like protein